MITTSHCKINIGLQVLDKRPDGYHNLSTLMYPLSQFSDIVELLRSDKDEFHSSGIEVDCSSDNNLCIKALRLMRSRYDIGNARILLHKQIPFGAGLGGGSANAVAVLKLVNSEFNLALSDATLADLASELGSDTPFFVHQKPMLATSRGEVLTPICLDLSSYYIYIVKPPFSISTSMAYSGVTAKVSDLCLFEAINNPISTWKDLILNDFESSLFLKYPTLKSIKQNLYDKGALYASLSGSGSAVYGIFSDAFVEPISDLWHIEHPIL